MAQQLIGIGTTANDGTGDPLRTSFDKVNDNITELYSGQSLSIVSDVLTLTRADGTTSTVDLSAYLDEDSRSIASGTLNAATGIVTFTRDDASTFTLDLSGLLDDTNIITSVNTQTGAVVLDADDIDDSATTNKFTSAADISKLAGIEAGADVTDTANVTAAGALMDSEVTNLADVKAFDPTDYATAAHEADTANPHSVTKAQVGLSNVDNTSDANKPVSTATQTALDAKQDTLIAGDITFSLLDPAAIITEAEGIASNDNDTTIPTSAAVFDFVSGQSHTDTTYTISTATDTAAKQKIVLTGSDSSTDEVTLEAGSHIQLSNLNGNILITNTSPGSGLNLSGGTGISVGGAYPNLSVTNTAPDQTVSLTQGSNISITGTYPNFTIAASNLVTNSSGQALSAATSLTLVTNTLTLTKGDGTTDTVDLSPYLDEDARAIASGVLNASTGIVTFTRDDATTFTLDLSALLDDTNLVTSVNGASGVVVLNTDNIAQGSTNLYDKTVSLTQSGATTISGTYPNFTISSTDTVYTHPTHPGDDFSVDSGPLTGATVISDIDINVTTDTLGHVTDANGAIATRTLTLADLGYTGATNANNYVHPTHAGDDINVDTGALTGATVISDLDFNITTDTLGHVTDANAAIATRNLTLADLGYTGATNANYITNNNQLTNGAGYTTNIGDITGVTAGSGLTGGGTSGTVTLNHADTSSAANLSASGRTYVTGLTFDTYGHVTGYTTGTETVTDTNTTYSPGAGLDLNGTVFSVESDLRGDVFHIGRDSNDYYTVGTTVHDWRLDGNLDMRLENDGDLHVDGDVVAYSTTTSDRRLKDNIKTIDSALEKVEKLRGVEYDWNATSRKGQHDMGVIAQEIEEVFPFLVREKELQTGEFADNPQTFKTVDYEKLVGVLIESVKELSAEVKELKSKING